MSPHLAYVFLLLENSPKNSKSFFFLLTVVATVEIAMCKFCFLKTEEFKEPFCNVGITLAPCWTCVGMSIDKLTGCFLRRSDYSQKKARVEGEFYIFSIGCYLFLKILLIFHMC